MNDSLRASDRDRDEVAGVLREQYAQGRLTMAEFDERSSAAYAARTVGELAELTTDLPTTTATQPPVPSSAWSPGAMRWVGIAAVVAVIAVVAGAAAGHVFAGWPVWIIVLIAIKLTHRGRDGHGRRALRDRGFRDREDRNGYGATGHGDLRRPNEPRRPPGYRG